VTLSILSVQDDRWLSCRSRSNRLPLRREPSLAFVHEAPSTLTGKFSGETGQSALTARLEHVRRTLVRQHSLAFCLHATPDAKPVPTFAGVAPRWKRRPRLRKSQQISRPVGAAFGWSSMAVTCSRQGCWTHSDCRSGRDCRHRGRAACGR